MRNRKKKNGDSRRENLSSLILDGSVFSATGSGIGFEKDAPLRLEIGCGKGDFVKEISKTEPDFNYIAVERISDVALMAIEKYASDRGLGKLSDHGEWIAPDGRVYKGEKWDIPLSSRGNVRFFIGPAEKLFPVLPAGSFDGIFTNFSDPWPKKGYESRRLTNPSYLREYARLLRGGGALTLKTDNVSLYEYSVASLENEGWTIFFKTDDLHAASVPDRFSPLGVVTEYESKFISRGVKINALVAAAPEKEL